MIAAVVLLFGSLASAPPAGDLEQALAALEEGRLEVAEQLLEQLLAAPEGDSRTVRLALAELLLDTGRAGEAMSILEPLALQSDAEASKLTGLVFAALGDEIEFADGPIEDADYFYGEALQQLERAAELATPSDTDAAVEAAYLALYIFADWALAESLVDSALTRAPHDGEALLARGCARVRGFAEMERHMTPSLRTANRDAAVADLLAAIEALGPERSEPWWQLIWMYEQDEQPALAVDAALAHHDATGRADSSTILRLALSCARSQALDASLTALQALIERDSDGLLAGLRNAEDPTSDIVALSWAVAPLLNRRSQAEARDLLLVLARADPQDADFWNNLAFLCRETAGSFRNAEGQRDATAMYEQSYAAYERAVAIDDSSPRLLNDTALILQYHLHRNLDRARFLYERAIALAEAGLDDTVDSATARELRSARIDARNNLSKLGSKRR